MRSPSGTVQQDRQPAVSHDKPAGPVRVAAPAETAVARQKVKQAQDLCRKASQRLAQADSIDVYAQRTCTGAQDVDAVLALVQLALTEHRHIDVVILTTSPT